MLIDHISTVTTNPMDYTSIISQKSKSRTWFSTNVVVLSPM